MNQNREDLEARIAAFIDGELPPDEAARLEVYLANTDQTLADQVIGMISDKYAVRHLPKVSSPEDLSGRIMEAVERTSLLHEVENLTPPKKPWWQTRSALAAGLLLILSGFTYVVIQSTVRDENGFHNFVEGRNGAKEQIARDPGGGELLGEKDTRKGSIASGDLLDSESRDGLAAKPGGAEPKLKSEAGKHAGVASKGDNLMGGESHGAELAQLREEVALNEQVLRSQAVVQEPVEKALKNGFAPASTPQVALENVKAAPTKFVSGTPVLINLVARDDGDPQRLRSFLQEMIRRDDAAATRQVALGNQLTLNNALQQNAGSYGVQRSARRAQNPQEQGKQIAQNSGGALAANALDYNLYNGANKDFERQYASNTTASASINDNSGSGARGGDQKALEAQTGANASGGSGNKQGSLQNEGDFSRNNTTNTLNPYRIILRADQLAQVTTNFEVYSITRGPSAYVIDNFTTRNSTARRDRYEGNSGANADGKGKIIDAPAPGTSAKGEQARAEADKESEKIAREQLEGTRKKALDTATTAPVTVAPQALASAPATAPLNKVSPAAEDVAHAAKEQWVEVIILMDAPAVPAANTSMQERGK